MATYPTMGHTASQPGAGSASLPTGSEDARALLRECFAQYRLKLQDLLRASLEQTNDLFETHSHIPDGEVESFRAKRNEWLQRFETMLCERFERRVVDGTRRQGRRPDADASLASLRVLTAFDHERQTALKDATRFLDRFTRRELAALDLRVEQLLGDGTPHDFDNPFSLPYILDAVGASARAVYPDPRIWRPFMERVLADLTPEVNKIFILLNRMLADRGVLPEIKAALRARSEHRPADDRDLLPTFSKMLHEAQPEVPRDIVVPEALSDPGAPPALTFGEKTVVAMQAGDVPVQEMSATRILAGLAALAAVGAQAASAAGMASDPAPERAPPAMDAAGFPSLDPLMALGTSTPLFTTLARWQRLDLPTAIAQMVPRPAEGSIEGTLVPRNLVPHIRAAIEDQIGSDTDRITMDVIALLFDYIFRDKSIPDSQRNLFGRLQVPIVKAALLDRTFFSDRRHPGRQLLDNLAEGAVGATREGTYLDEFTALATEVVADVCRDFEIDVEVFRQANARLAAFLEGERQRVAEETTSEVVAALNAEQVASDASLVRAFLRDRLAGVDVPFEIRGFIETVWADYLTALRRDHGADSDDWAGAVRTLDDLLWSIVAKERTAQKARLTRMIPALIGALRRGCTALAVAPERPRAFFETLYQLHIAAIKPTEENSGATSDAATSTQPPMPVVNAHDYVSEMAVGTWLEFMKEGQAVNAKLTWVSPLRTKYLFTSRERARAFVYTPEELAYELNAGQVSLVVEPVPLFDRAVSAALETLAARKSPAAA